MKKLLIISIFLFLNLIFSYCSGRYTFWRFDFFDSEIYDKFKSNEKAKKIKKWAIKRYDNNNIISETFIQFDKNGNEIELLHYVGKSMKTPVKITYEYNEKNEMVKSIKEFDGSVDFSKENTVEEYTREYNKDGKIIKFVSIYTRILNDEIFKKEEGIETALYTYEQNKIKEIETTYSGTRVFKRKETVKYNINEQIIEKLTFDINKNILVAEEYYAYNDNNNLIEEKRINTKKLFYIFKYEYDNNNLIKKTKYDEKEKLVFTVKYEYNEYGQLSKVYDYNKNGNFYHISDYKYIKNDNGDIIEVIKEYGDPKKKKKDINRHEYNYEYWD